jgi:hypothetical protein
MSSENWKDWVTEQRQEYSQRKKSAHLTRESESSSLAWPTATVFDTTGGSYPTEIVDGVYRSKHSQDPNSPWYGAKLRDAVETHEGKKNWATPNTMDHMGQRSPEALQRQFETTRKGRTQPANLREQVHPQNWPTITVNESHNTPCPSQFKRNTPPLGTAVLLDGQQDQVNPNTNGKSQELQGKLNPNWVEHLMGLPAGWTDLGCWETE